MTPFRREVDAKWSPETSRALAGAGFWADDEAERVRTDRQKTEEESKERRRLLSGKRDETTLRL